MSFGSLLLPLLSAAVGYWLRHTNLFNHATPLPANASVLSETEQMVLDMLKPVLANWETAKNQGVLKGILADVLKQLESGVSSPASPQSK